MRTTRRASGGPRFCRLFIQDADARSQQLVSVASRFFSSVRAVMFCGSRYRALPLEMACRTTDERILQLRHDNCEMLIPARAVAQCNEPVEAAPRAFGIAWKDAAANRSSAHHRTHVRR